MNYPQTIDLQNYSKFKNFISKLNEKSFNSLTLKDFYNLIDLNVNTNADKLIKDKFTYHEFYQLILVTCFNKCGQITQKEIDKDSVFIYREVCNKINHNSKIINTIDKLIKFDIIKLLNDKNIFNFKTLEFK